jgi:deoxycytidine triphosphate deaminase
MVSKIKTILENSKIPIMINKKVGIIDKIKKEIDAKIIATNYVEKFSIDLLSTDKDIVIFDNFDKTSIKIKNDILEYVFSGNTNKKIIFIVDDSDGGDFQVCMNKLISI